MPQGLPKPQMTRDILNQLYNDVIQNNLKMGREIKNLTAPNGSTVSNVIPGGWGSIAQISVDGETGDIKGIHRVPTSED
jgi:hypothetical protein